MKKIRLLCGLMLLAGTFVSGDALADRYGHGHGHGRAHVGVGLYFGVPYPHPYYPSPYYYPYPYYPPDSYYPPVVAVPSQPPIYIEQSSPESAPQAVSSWYHCDNPEGYYPYIKECPGGWTAVSPTPPPQQ
jgi:hypothetical protein